MSFYENWVELDLNPVITFSSDEKVIYLNQAAQSLLNNINSLKIYNLALEFAPENYGFKTSYIDISIKNWTFYAITVGYESDEQIFVKLYKSIKAKKEKLLENDKSQLASIFTVLDLSISLLKSSKPDLKIIKNHDPSIPAFKIDVPSLLKIFAKIYESFEEYSSLTTTMKLKIGEFIKLEGKKYPLINIEITSNGHLQNHNELENASFDLCKIIVENNSVFIDLPMILN